jgi:3-oxoacyl-[acyl-carrier protein] reductase
MEDLLGRVALVTGASRGLGRAIALQLARAGADVALNYRENAAAAHEAVAEIEALGRKAVALKADVGDPVAARELVASARIALAPATILVNNAGIARPQKIEDITNEDWDELIRVNLSSAFYVTQAALPAMRAARWGRIINLSSVAAHVGGVVGPHYAASKAGLLGLTHSYAALLVHEGITANAISPALIDTDMVRSNALATPERIPVGRFGEPDEVADVTVMLARNGYITGQTIHVNGGWYMS